MVLVQKMHSGTSLSMEDTQQIVNRQCIALGEPLDPEIDIDSTSVAEPEPIDISKVKVRISMTSTRYQKSHRCLRRISHQSSNG